MKLPTTKQPPKHTLTEFTMLIHGPSKIGKTEWCSKIPDALFLATENGHSHVEAYVLPVRNWEEFLAACAEIAKGGHPFKCVIVDTINNLFDFCNEYVCAKNKVQHESDLAYGKGHSLVRNEFIRALTKLSMLGLGLVLIGHSTEREYETRTGKRIRVVPMLPEKIRQFVVGQVDIIGFCTIETVEGENGRPRLERVMYTKPSADYDAGDRTGRLPPRLPLDFKAFAEAWQSAVAVKGPVKSAG